MKVKMNLKKRIISALLCLALMLTYFPLSAAAAAAEAVGSFDRVVDNNTMNNWTKYFDLDDLNTANAGGVWTDKSVFTDASVFDGKISMIDDEKNFLTALSTLAANKEVVGYSTIPTDTVLVLDLSNSMPTGARTQLIEAANNAIKQLQEANKNNRVGVVLYAGNDNGTYDGSVTRLMPLDRYTTTRSDGDFIRYDSGAVSVYEGVAGNTAGTSFGSKRFGGATYMQAGLWEAYKMFDEVPDSDIVIGKDNWQAGEHRMPIVVLMSDGAPTFGASAFDNVENQTYNNRYRANVGDGSSSGAQVGQGFLVQLTASYIKNRIENKYRVNEENGAGRSLFYTLGFNLSNISDNTAKQIASSVLNPDNSTLTDSLWATYNSESTRTMSVRVERPSGSDSNVSITKNSYATSKSYVDQYFSASGDGLTAAFKDLVEEIVLQSRYYPTHLEGGSPDFAGYVEFTDTLGEYMEVKHINGILLGNTLFDGHMMASKISDNSEDGLGTAENPSELGDEFIRAVKTRLKIADNDTAYALVRKAFEDGQLRYNGADDWSNYIAWYAKEDLAYAGFYDEDGTEAVPADAVYIIRSYGFLGETTGSIKNSDMMYMSVQVRTNVKTGEQTVSWKIPAALVPMVTYLVSLTGTNVDTATDVSVTVEGAENVSPIRLIYETGLRSDLNAFNITNITGKSINDTKLTDERHLDTDGHTRLFWNNSYDITAKTHDEHITTMSEFTPNKENERFYYTFDSAVYKKSGNDYVLVGENETLDETATNTYYHRRYVFTDDSDTPIFLWEPMSAASIKVAKDNGFKSDFTTIDNKKVGAWFVPKGTPARELKMYDESKAEGANAPDTRSAHMVFHPYISEHNNTVYVDTNLGNNGLLLVTPATGIKVSKTVDIFETGTSDVFKFRISAPLTGDFDAWITALNQTPTGDGFKATFANGIYEVELKKDQTLWLSDIPAGTTYTVEEISDNTDYKVKSVHVNGALMGKVAAGTVAQYMIDDVAFVNTAIGEGDLVITKQVVNAQGATVDIADSVKFTAEVLLTNAAGEPVTGTFASSAGNITLQNGKYTVTLTEGESFVIRGIPEGTTYTVTEKNIPAGFALNTEKSKLSGVVDATANDQALIVNTYAPVEVNGQAVNVEIAKEITGNRTEWLRGESYTFQLERLDLTRAVGTVIATATIGADDTAKTHLFSLANEKYTAAGTYYYRVTELKGTQGGITYDTAERSFSVTVADENMDGTLEIVAVSNMLNTTVSGKWLVSAKFSNVYAPTGSAATTINIQKDMANHALGGYQFALYDADPSKAADAEEIVRSALTDAAGKTAITLTYSVADAGKTYTYYLAEINRGQVINNIQYSDKVYKVEVTIKDDLNGAIYAQTEIDLTPGQTVPTFTNTYVPSASDFITLSGKKEIVGDRVLNANEFAFVIEALTADAPMPNVTTVMNAADGSFAFPTIEFGDAHKGKTYQYKITESDANKIGGFTYDTTVYTVTVTVADNGDQTITATAVINNGNSNVDDMVFQNTYDATDATVTLEGTKLLTGKTMQDDEFTFELKAVTAGAPMPSAAAVKNTANGKFVFGTITYAKAGVYVYELSEQDGGIANYDYDKSVYTVTVTVTDNSQGLLTARVAIAKDGMPSTEVVFRNGFVPTPISYEIHTDFGGEKVLSGRDGKPLAEGEFTFKLINAPNGEQIGDTVTNAADGTFKFPAVSLNAAGVYHFKVVEVIGDVLGVTYDTSSYHIRLEVVQDANGVLTVKDKQLHKGVVSKQDVDGVLTEVTTYENITGSGKIVFNNTYTATPTYVILEATKILIGRELVEGEFKFDLHKTAADFAYDETTVWQDDVRLTLKDNGDGIVIFRPETFNEIGSYYYVIVEDEIDENGITTDKTAHKVEIVVTDDHHGDLTAAIKVNGEDITGAIADTVVFRNIYTAPEPDLDSPDTGVASQLWLWFALALTGGAGVFGSGVIGKKKVKGS
ncbi:MAG: hypothetical protein IJF42_06495 [Clostridia bacterium]|nr:hypothetical protein [Clostridia bacterium]